MTPERLAEGRELVDESVRGDKVDEQSVNRLGELNKRCC